MVGHFHKEIQTPFLPLCFKYEEEESLAPMDPNELAELVEVDGVAPAGVNENEIAEK